MTPALSIREVSKTFPTPEGGEVRALDSVSLEIADGSFTVLLGPSGCGKTTLLRCIAGLESPDSGEIDLKGVRIDDVPVWKRRVNTVFQSYALFPHMTVAQNIAFGLQMDKMPKAEIGPKVDKALEMVRLGGLGARRPSQLSGGQQQRVALARALAKEPEVLLLDEPLSALDLKLRRGMQMELKRLQRETSITFVLVTHDQDEAMSMGDQVAVFDSGRIVQVGTPREVYLAPTTRFVADFIGEANILEGTASGGAITVAGFGIVAPQALASDSPRPADGTAYLAVRPESVVVTPSPEGNGRVVDAIFVGGDLLIEVRAGDAVLAARQSGTSLALTSGDAVRVEFLPGSARIVDA
ncbi:MAG: ABC transporter ATP-binding protein [Candidatus Nanopelagicales bacterium]